MLSKFTGSVISYFVVGGVAATSVAWFAWNNGHSVGHGKATKQHERERNMFITREIALWHELGAARTTQIELVEGIENMWNLSGKARRKMQAALTRSKQEAQAAANAAAFAIRRLEDVETQAGITWKQQPIPDDVLVPIECLRDPAAECADSATGADRDMDMEVRQSATGDE